MGVEAALIFTLSLGAQDLLWVRRCLPDTVHCSVSPSEIKPRPEASGECKWWGPALASLRVLYEVWFSCRSHSCLHRDINLVV